MLEGTAGEQQDGATQPSSSPGCGCVPTLPLIRPRPYGNELPCPVQEQPPCESAAHAPTGLVVPPYGWWAPLAWLLHCYNHGINEEVRGLRLAIGIGAAEGERDWLAFEGR
jgi:hypothetical protein